MIALVLSMIRARPFQALTVFLLATFAVAAAVSAPVYLAAADRSVVAGEVAAAGSDERNVQVRRAAEGGDTQFDQLAPAAFAIPGFTSVYSAEYDGYVAGVRETSPRMVYRDRVCDHLRIVSGRCFATTGEIIITPDMAKVMRVGVGGSIPVVAGTLTKKDGYVPAVPNDGPTQPTKDWKPADGPFNAVRLTIVGLYQPLDTGELYWSDANYFDTRLTDRNVTAPAFGNRRTLESVPHIVERQGLDVFVGDTAITAESLQRVNAGVHAGVAKLSGLDRTTVTTKLPNLIAATNRNRSLVAEVVPVAAIPLVGLCWFVLFVAVSAATQERRYELGLLALRGVRPPHRWWLAAGEAIVPILLGSFVGYFVGHMIVRLAAALLLDGAGDVPLSTGLSRWVLITVAGALLVALLAQRRELAASTSDLLRNVPNRAGRWRSLLAETIVVLLAAAAVVQLRSSDTGLRGVAALAPALVVFAIGLLAARALGPFADRLGARAVQQGRIGRALAAYSLSRRPGSQRVVALLVVAIALVCFVGTAASVAAQGRDERADVELGAPSVVSVRDISMHSLLQDVRVADPQGTWAMAATRLSPGVGDSATPTLAIDAQRLPAVAEWRDPSKVATVAAKLHPKDLPPSVMVTNADMDIDMTLDKLVDGFRVALIATVAPLDGTTTTDIVVAEVQPGRHTYTQSMPVCVDRCRLVGFALKQPEGRPFAADFTLHEVRQSGKVLIGSDQFAAAGAWRGPATPGAKLQVSAVTPVNDGLRVSLPQSNGNDVSIEALAGDWPSPMPIAVASAAAAPDHLVGGSSNYVPLDPVVSLGLIPRYGVQGVLVDLDFVDRSGAGAAPAGSPEVWLGAEAPPDALARLRKAGLVVASEQHAADLRAAYDKQGPAVAIRFHALAAGFAVVLAAGALWLVAGVDRRRRAIEVRALRAQGVSRRDAGASGYLAMTAAAAALGLVAGLIGWALVGQKIPIFVDTVTSFAPTNTPTVAGLGIPWLVAGVALAGVALLATMRLRLLAGGYSRDSTVRPMEPVPEAEENQLVDVSSVHTTPSIWEERR